MTPDTSDNPTLTLDGARLSDTARIRYHIFLETEDSYEAIEILVPHATSIDPPGPRPPPTPRAEEVCAVAAADDADYFASPAATLAVRTVPGLAEVAEFTSFLMRRQAGCEL